MLKSIIAVVVSVAILQVCLGAVFDAKQDALKTIDAKFKEVEALKNNIIKAIQSERQGIQTTGEKDLIKYLEAKTNETGLAFDMDARAVLKTAIIKAKPVSVIYCIRQVTFWGADKHRKLSEENRVKVLEIRADKIEKTKFDEYVVREIFEGLKELTEESKSKINAGSGAINTLLKEALNNCESATLLLGEVEASLHEPILSKEYVKMRQEIDRSFKQLQSLLISELEKCLK